MQTQRPSEGSGKRRKWENPDTKHLERWGEVERSDRRVLWKDFVYCFEVA